MIKRRRNQHPFPSEEAILESVRLYEEGWTLKEIGKKMNRAASGIHRWIHEYAPLIVNNGMKHIKDNGKDVERTCGTPSGPARRATGVKAPETTPETPSGTETPEQKIARLERELRDARLMRDFYDEMINVAEQQFNIQIRKKAGTGR